MAKPPFKILWIFLYSWLLSFGLSSYPFVLVCPVLRCWVWVVLSGLFFGVGSICPVVVIVLFIGVAGVGLDIWEGSC
jgi:hypothetical protein